MAGRILIADTTATHRIALRAMLASARHEVDSAETSDEALALARARRPDLVLTDAALALDPSDPLISRLRADPRTSGVPVIVLTSRSDADLRIAALRAGADDVTLRPGPLATLLARIRSHLRAADTAQALGQRDAAARQFGFAEQADAFRPPARVALIAHDPARAEHWHDVLLPHLTQPVFSLGVSEALAEADRDMAADLFVIEAALAHPGEALGLLADLRARAKTRHAAILIVHDRADTQTATMALDLGASDLVEAEFAAEELALRIGIQLDRKQAGDRLRASVDERLRLAMEDPLTGLFNRRYALTHAHLDKTRGFCVILADIDRFKAVNDQFGHGSGDAVLVEVARRLRDNVRGMDTVSRIGGEEFLILLPDRDPAAAEAAARRLCAIVHDTPVALPGGRAPLRVTASFGVAMGEPGDTLEDVIERADRALYEAKAAGRDTVTVDASCAA